MLSVVSTGIYCGPFFFMAAQQLTCPSSLTPVFCVCCGGIRDRACRSAKEEAINRIEEKSRALQSIHEQVTADLARVDQQNKRELQISDQLLASVQVLLPMVTLMGATAFK